MNDEERFYREQRHRTALHEAGHVTMSRLFGIPVETVSIRAGEYFRGVTISRRGALDFDEVDLILASRGGNSLLAHYGLRPALFDADLLGRVAVEIMCDLAGEGAVLLLEWPPASGYRVEDDSERATNRALALTAPSPDELKYLEKSEHEKIATDEERVYTAAKALAEHDMEATHLVAYLRHGTRRIIVSELFAKPCLVMAEALDEHTVLGHETLRSLFADHRGEEVVATGDGFFVGFDSPDDALGCAVAIQRRLAEHRRLNGFAPKVRIGVHASGATQVGRNFSGKGVHEAARIAALADGDQILSSLHTASGSRFPTSETRNVTLRGTSEPIEIVTIEWS